MNANELADELETGEFIEFFELHTQFWKRSKIVEAVAMLRQQQAEIEALKAEKDRITRDLIGASFYEHDYKTLMAKPPLTDEEIYELADQCRKLANPNVEFAKAILRKASEK